MSKFLIFFSRAFERICGFQYFRQLFVVLMLFHGYFLFVYAVDVPYWDEWELFHPSTQEKLFTWDWLVSFHNEHRIVWTRLLTGLLAHSPLGLDFKALQIFNFFLYSLLIVFLWILWSRWTRGPHAEMRSWGAPFFIFFASALSFENLAWGFQSQFHFFLLFFVCGILAATHGSWTSVVLAVICFVASMFSFSAGLICGQLGLLSMLFLPQVILLGVAQRWIVRFGILGVSLLSLFAWKSSYPSLAGHFHPAYTLPYKLKFWQHYLSMLSAWFGKERLNDLVTLFTAVLWVVLIVFLMRIFKKFLSQTFKGSAHSLELRLQDWSFMVWSVSILAALASISVGRAGFGIGQGVTSRYTEIVLMLLPAVIFSIANMKWSQTMRKACLGIFWLGAVLGFANNFNFYKVYKGIHENRTEGLLCLAKNPVADCPTLYPHPLSDRLAVARALGARFLESVEELKRR